ncbi:MAG: Ig-like domain-containing protein [Dysgonamonadaceae bacterium]|jgi:uncharacterized protein (DUF2141 family)|nr:Ig-like domain-containing protein [Dysgonamonadaceae bacterium]
MCNKIYSLLSLLFLTVLSTVILHSCANIASPTGGPRDEDPPVPMRATPNFNSLNVTTTRIVIEFDENIKIVRPSENVIITPPQINMPIIRAIGRRAIVELNDELKPNTTYVIDFTDAIVDNNEDNPLENFVFSFSTGDQLDTLAISGRVLAARDLEPQQGIFVGVHTNLEDTAFTRTAFDRISRTDSRGNFTIRGMAPGTYRVYALADANRNYMYDDPQETIAFLEEVVIPTVTQATRQDTIFNRLDSEVIDTIFTVNYTRFLPDDIVLRTFVSDFQRMFLRNSARPERHQLEINFGAPTELATFTLLNPERTDSDWYVMERSARNDSLKLWITDSLVFNQDSIQMKINFLRTDSLNIHVLTTDTINFNMRQQTAREQRRNRNTANNDGDEEPQIEFLNIRTNIQSTFELFNPIRIEFEQPILHFDSTLVQLALEVDTIFTPTPFRLEVDSLNPRKYTLRPRWQPGATYKITIDSAAVHSHYGIWNNTLEQRFTIKDIDQYGNLEINISGLPEGVPAFVELLDKSDKPFRQRSVINSIARFQDLPPGEIFFRLVVDENGDGEWTTGNFEEGRQPEMVYYFHESITIRAFADHSLSWNVLATPLIEQKPLEITTNKPEERRENPAQRREREERERQQQRQQNSSSGGGRNNANPQRTSNNMQR